MSDQKSNTIENELREQEATDNGLTVFFASIVPPFSAKERLLSSLENAFTESMLTLDDDGPYSFENAAAMAQIDEATTDLLAAGLEEDPIDDDDVDEDE